MKTHLILAGAVCVLAGTRASAATLFGSTADGRLISFDSATPGTVQTNVPITGLVDQGESVAGLDFRPATGQLYALGTAQGSVYRLYTINTVTGVATQVGSGSQELSGGSWGFDFNPTVDRIRAVNNNGSSIRLNPNDGTVAGFDTNLSTNGIAAVAYDRNDNNPATLTTLFGINTTTAELVRIGGVDGTPSPNGGVVTPVGLLGVTNMTAFASLDIYSDGTAFAVITTTSFAPVRGNPFFTNLYTINLSTGAATPVGSIATAASGLTGFTSIPEPGSATALALAGLTLGARRRRHQ